MATKALAEGETRRHSGGLALSDEMDALDFVADPKGQS